MPKAAVKTSPRAKRTKAEVREEFSAVQDEVQTARESADTKADELAKQKEAEVRQAVEGVSVDGVVEQISKLGLDISRALSGISEKLVDEVNRLASLRQAVGLERQELERLHKVDVAAAALDLMVQEYEQQKEQLESEIAAQRSEWEAGVQTAERERKEQEEILKKQRQRDIDEYEYKKNLERKRAQDKYDEEVRQRDKENKERQETLNKSWAEREAALREQEEELLRLRKESADLPARLQREMEQAAARAAEDARRQSEQQALLLKKEAEADRRIAELQIKTLEDVITRQNALIADLQKQMDEAKKQVQEIAVRAIEGASGAKTLAHVNEIAMEQAKHRGPQS
jgi:colicin import membrane protein